MCLCVQVCVCVRCVLAKKGLHGRSQRMCVWIAYPGGESKRCRQGLDVMCLCNGCCCRCRPAAAAALLLLVPCCRCRPAYAQVRQRVWVQLPHGGCGSICCRQEPVSSRAAATAALGSASSSDVRCVVLLCAALFCVSEGCSLLELCTTQPCGQRGARGGTQALLACNCEA